jgi:hypothetical protein
VADHPLRPATRLSLGRPLPYQLADGPRAQPRVQAFVKRPAFTSSSFEIVVLCGISTPFGMLSPALGKVTHVLLTRAPLYRGRSPFSCDLHVLSAPLTFVLSQDQTLQLNLVSPNGLGRPKPDVPRGSIFLNWRVASAIARSKRARHASRSPGAHSFDARARWARASVKVSVRFSFQGPREPARGSLAPVNGDANLSCATFAGQLFLFRGGLFPSRTPSRPSAAHRLVPAWSADPRASEGTRNLIGGRQQVKVTTRFRLR